MKAQMKSSCLVGGKTASFLVGGVHRGGRVEKKGKKSKEEDDVNTSGGDMMVYLNKLQEIVPLMPKNKILSKVEVISFVIDYIHDLRETLGLPPCTAVDQEDYHMEEDSCAQFVKNTDNTTNSTLCSSKVCDSTVVKKQEQECCKISGEE